MDTLLSFPLSLLQMSSLSLSLVVSLSPSSKLLDFLREEAPSSMIISVGGAEAVDRRIIFSTKSIISYLCYMFISLEGIISIHFFCSVFEPLSQI